MQEFPSYLFTFFFWMDMLSIYTMYIGSLYNVNLESAMPMLLLRLLLLGAFAFFLFERCFVT